MNNVLSPSDLSKLNSGEKVLVGGRVLMAQPREIVLADALSAVRIVSQVSAPVSVGDLLVIEAEVQAGQIHLVALLSRQEHPEPRGDGEFSRLQRDARGHALRARSLCLSVVRSYFEEEGFIEVETPTFVPNPGMDPHVHSLAEVRRGQRTDHLITSPEFHMKRLLTGGLPRIYQLARCFRSEELGATHEPEFTLLEWYRSFANWQSMLKDTEEIVSRVFAAVGKSQEYPGGRILRPFDSLTIREAFRQYAGVDDAVALATHDQSTFFEVLLEKVEPGIAQRGRPTFLTHYPVSMAALARKCPEDQTVAERFELYIGRTEVCNGYGELTEEAEQRARFVAELKRRSEANEPNYAIDERFLSALIEGMPPAAGNALGLDRLIALALGLPRIANTLAFSDAER